jgi:uroporphyrinogen decarboxylase
MTHLAPVIETVARLRQDLPKETALIGFCGAPWTVATYMVEGQGSKEQAAARIWAYRDGSSEGFGALIGMLVDASADYLCAQVTAGADVLQIFDTWAGSLPDMQFESWVVAPTAEIVARVKRRHPGVPIIGFPRGAGPRLARYVEGTNVDGVGCDTAMPLDFARMAVPPSTVLQGNLDPLLLVAGGKIMENRIRDILEDTAGHPFIFNLGHGITPEASPENVARLVEIVRGG